MILRGFSGNIFRTEDASHVFCNNITKSQQLIQVLGLFFKHMVLHLWYHMVLK